MRSITRYEGGPDGTGRTNEEDARSASRARLARIATRRAGCALGTVRKRIAEITKKRPSAYPIELMNEVGVPCGPLYTIDPTFADPQVQHLEMARPIDQTKLGPIKAVSRRST